MSHGYKINKKLKKLKRHIEFFNTIKKQHPDGKNIPGWSRQLMTRITKLIKWYPSYFTMEHWPGTMEQMFL